SSPPSPASPPSSTARAPPSKSASTPPAPASAAPRSLSSPTKTQSSAPAQASTPSTSPASACNQHMNGGWHWRLARQWCCNLAARQLCLPHEVRTTVAGGAARLREQASGVILLVFPARRAD